MPTKKKKKTKKKGKRKGDSFVDVLVSLQHANDPLIFANSAVVGQEQRSPIKWNRLVRVRSDLTVANIKTKLKPIALPTTARLHLDFPFEHEALHVYQEREREQEEVEKDKATSTSVVLDQKEKEKEGNMVDQDPCVIKTYFLRRTGLEQQEHIAVSTSPGEKYLSEEEIKILEAERRAKRFEEKAQWNARLRAADFVVQCSTDTSSHIILPPDVENDIVIEDLFQASHTYRAKQRKHHKKHGFPPSETASSMHMLNLNFGKMSKRHFPLSIHINPRPFLLSVLTLMGQVIDLHEMVDVITTIRQVKKMIFEEEGIALESQELFLLTNEGQVDSKGDRQMSALSSSSSPLKPVAMVDDNKCLFEYGFFFDTETKLDIACTAYRQSVRRKVDSEGRARALIGLRLHRSASSWQASKDPAMATDGCCDGGGEQVKL